jgi:hypothetical protein
MQRRSVELKVNPWSRSYPPAETGLVREVVYGDYKSRTSLTCQFDSRERYEYSPRSLQRYWHPHRVKMQRSRRSIMSSASDSSTERTPKRTTKVPVSEVGLLRLSMYTLGRGDSERL